MHDCEHHWGVRFLCTNCQDPINVNTDLSAALHGLRHICEVLLHLYMFLCVCVCPGTPGRGAGVFPPERGCQWASLSPAVWQYARIISRDGGSRMEESKGGKKGERGSDWVSRAARLNIRLESITHTAMHFALSHAISPPQRARHGTLLCHRLPFCHSVRLHPS